MRFARNILLATLALGAAACSDEDLGPSRAVIPPLAYVRYINATPDTLNHNVRFVDDIEFTPQSWSNVAFREEGQGGFQGLRAGNRHFKVFTYQQLTNNFPVAGNTTVLKDTTFNFQAGKYYSIIHTGFTRAGATPAAQVLIIEDDPPASPATGTLVRVYNLAYDGSWDVYLGPTATQVHDTLTGDPTYGPAELGTLVASTTPGTAGTVVVPYGARALGNFHARIVASGSMDRLAVTAAGTANSSRVVVPAGLPETADFEAAGGSNINGSVLTLWVFGPKTVGSEGATGNYVRPSVYVSVDRSPARTIAP